MRIKAATFDTGGTILDWHSGIRDAFAEVGHAHGLERDWAALTNQYRRLSMKGIVGQSQPAFNMDDVHRRALDEICDADGLSMFTTSDRQRISSAWHRLSAWPDFAGSLKSIRQRVPAISFTMLPIALVIDVSRLNGISWDAVVSCEAIGHYKPNPLAYQQTAKWLAMEPGDILMVACHNFDLNAARACGFKTAFIRRPQEWGSEPPPDPTPHPDCDFVFDGFEELASEVERLST